MKSSKVPPIASWKSSSSSYHKCVTIIPIGSSASLFQGVREAFRGGLAGSLVECGRGIERCRCVCVCEVRVRVCERERGCPSGRALLMVEACTVGAAQAIRERYVTFFLSMHKSRAGAGAEQE